MLDQRQYDLGCFLVLGTCNSQRVNGRRALGGRIDNQPSMTNSTNAWNDSSHVSLQLGKMQRSGLWRVDNNSNST